MPKQSNERLCAAWRDGDAAALDTLVEQNLPFVFREANRFAKTRKRPDLTDELIQEGALGLIEAAGKYDPARGNSFLTYAGFWVRKQILAFLKSETDYESVRTDELPQVTDVAWTALEAFSQSPEQLCIQAETVAELHRALQAIPKRESAYLLYRFGFPDESKNKTRKETAEHFYLTASRAAAIENAALKDLRSALPW